MRYICSSCGKVTQEQDTTIHYTKGSSRFEIVAICQLCLDGYLEKTKVDTNRKASDTERMEMKRKW
jgi:predicted RNA-binding protein with PUA-like domain